METSPREAIKAVSKQIMKMYCWVVIFCVFANKSPMSRLFDTDLETLRCPQPEPLKTIIMSQNTASLHTRALDTRHIDVCDLEL